jgi:site-specific DNA recombinase
MPTAVWRQIIQTRARQLRELVSGGVVIVIARELPLGTTPEQMLWQEIRSVLAAYRRERVARGTCRGKLRCSGYDYRIVLSRPPYGYRYVRGVGAAPGYWEVEELEAAVVRWIFARHARGESIAAISRWLSASGRLTRAGNQRWDRSTVTRILHNPVYQGYAAYAAGGLNGTTRRGHRTSSETRGGNTIPLGGRSMVEEWTLIVVPAIVSAATFALVQEGLVRNGQPRRLHPRHITFPPRLPVAGPAHHDLDKHNREEH